MAYLGRVNEDHFHPGNTLDTFTGDGVTVTYTLSKSVPGGAESQLTVVVNNVIQDPSSAYSVGGSNNDQLTFSGAPNSGALIYVIHQGFFTTTLTPAGESVGAEHLQPNLRNFRLDSFVGTGANSSFTLSDTPASPNSVIVFVGGVYQTPLSNYSVVGNTLSFDESPLLNETITVLHLGFQTSSRVVPDGSITAEKLSSTLKTFNVDSFTGDGTTVAFTLTEEPVTENSILVSINGLIQKSLDNYSLSGTTLTFTSAPKNLAIIRVIHLGFKSGQIGVLDGSVTTPKLASNSVDLTTKVTNILPLTNGGTGAPDAPGARTTLNVYSKTEIDLNKANISSPALTGTPTAPTAPQGTNNTQLATTAFVNSMALGVGQTWQSFTNTQRIFNTIYTNTTNKPIYVTVGVIGPGSTYTQISASVSGVSIPGSGSSTAGSGVGQSVSFIVPAGNTYSVNNDRGSFWMWSELR